MIIINLATIDFGGGGGNAKPLKTEPLIANVWSRGRRVFTPANYNVDGFSDVTINTAVIGDNSALDFSLIGWDGNESDDANVIYNVDIEYSKSVLDKWNNGQISNFSNDNKLKYAPLVNVSNSNMRYFFENCNFLQFVPPFDTQNVTDMSGMFKKCKLLTTIPLLNTQNVTNMTNMFYFCEKLTTIPLLNTQNVTNMNNMFYFCSNLQSIPLLDTQNVTDMSYMFHYCSNLQSIPLLDTSNVTTMNRMFESSFNGLQYLTELGGFKNLKIDWNDNYGLAICQNLTYQSVMNVLNNLYDFRANGDMSTTKTIKINSNTYNLLTADDIAFANNKGWNITK